jgi:hypothetical protein
MDFVEAVKTVGDTGYTVLPLEAEDREDFYLQARTDGRGVECSSRATLSAGLLERLFLFLCHLISDSGVL